jgi:hypothetical protein
VDPRFAATTADQTLVPLFERLRHRFLNGSSSVPT